MANRRLCLLLLLLATCIGLAVASYGDQLDIFQQCVQAGLQNRCDRHGLRTIGGNALPWPLRLTGWSCASDVDYRCQREVTDLLVRQGQPIEQFHGKWPFVRVLGVQEPMSMIFSVVNGIVHLRGLYKVQSRLSSDKDPMYPYYVALAIIGMNAWLWSTVFHTRDLRWTERMDYFSAGAYVLYGLFYAPIRMFQLYRLSTNSSTSTSRYTSVVSAWGAVLLLLYLGHVSYLSLWRFDYGYNMAANVVVGALHGVVWLVYTAKYYRPGRPRWVLIPAVMVVVLAGAMSLELLDFYQPHWIDAHALWHASTIPITAWWYSFLVKDSLAERQAAAARKSGNLD